MNFIRTWGPIGRALRDVSSKVCQCEGKIGSHSTIHYYFSGENMFLPEASPFPSSPYPVAFSDVPSSIISFSFFYCPQVPQTQKYFAEHASTPTHMKKASDNNVFYGVVGLLTVSGLVFTKGSCIVSLFACSCA